MIVPMLPIEQNLVLKAVLINKSDIDLTTLTQSGATVCYLRQEKLVLMLVGLNNYNWC
jgi:hypothetical protein